ncbi:MAG: oxidoreductase [Betaproteobacteria bacterium RIFCSPLOWO2_12_FULL_63_13]|nr:MAG: oxidoreductase [Betaproteobacteria bacterium RIFCSPLOWO2_02_FULL_63_19]OGA45910.1 MAG: oxidoreductase [Betaproteobacteria bacterium RIFCSPLOWO2_12_FULL_63_13]
MATLIKKRRFVADSWQLLECAADGALPEVTDTGAVIVPLALWRARRDALLARGHAIGVWLDSGESAEDIAADLNHFAVVAVSFPTLSDGRGYSTARLLRERHGFTGELRAIGEVRRDQLLFLERCGFDAFALRDDQDAEHALEAFEEFSEAYQVSVTQPVPLFRRRASSGPAA